MWKLDLLHCIWSELHFAELKLALVLHNMEFDGSCVILLCEKNYLGLQLNTFSLEVKIMRIELFKKCLQIFFSSKNHKQTKNRVLQTVTTQNSDFFAKFTTQNTEELPQD